MPPCLSGPSKDDHQSLVNLPLSGDHSHRVKRIQGGLDTDEYHGATVKRRKVSALCEQCEEDLPLFKAIFQENILPPSVGGKFITSRTWPPESNNQECKLCLLFIGQNIRREHELRAAKSGVSVKIYKKRFLHSIREHHTGVKDKSDRSVRERKDLDTLCLESRFMRRSGGTERSSLIVPASRSPGSLPDDQEAELSHSSQSYAVRVVNPRRFDENLVASWLRTCKMVHGSQCATGEYGRAPDTVDYIWLIDCATRQLQEAAITEKYVALSYVWGMNYRHSENTWNCEPGAKLPDILPLTIEDAITATLRLSYRFLWVDHFCINQSDGAHKASQIAMMDLIYGKSELVIIAAAGEDADYGLPGVDSVQRIPQPHYKVDDELTLLSYPGHPHHSIFGSVWNSRGWTFQEAMLAKRRLVFTDAQVYFECQCISVWESLRRPLAYITSTHTKRIKSGIRAGFFQSGCTENHVFNQKGNKSVFELLIKAIPTYLQRNLTYEEDFLNAFQGFMEALYPRKNFHGLPLVAEKKAQVENQTQISIIKALSWEHDNRIGHPKYSSAIRRVGFPSFSWIGWTGRPDLNACSYAWDGGEMASFPGLDLTQVASAKYPGLKIRGLTSRLRLLCRSTHSTIEYCAVTTGSHITMSEPTRISRPLQGEGLQLSEKRGLEVEVGVLFLGNLRRGNGKSTTRAEACLLFERKEDFVERCGTLQWSKDDNRTDDRWKLENYLLEPWREEVLVLR